MLKRPTPCPHCDVPIPAVAIRVSRPFSCPSCRRLAVSTNPYSWIATSSFAAFLGLGIALAVPWARRGHSLLAIVGPVAGLLAGILSGNLVSRILDNFQKIPVRLRKHLLRDEPRLVVELAALVDLVRQQHEWTSENDQEFEALYKQQSLDEGLMEEAFFAVGELKRRLMGESEDEKGVSNEIRELSLAELRIELAAIACDLRLATE